MGILMRKCMSPLKFDSEFFSLPLSTVHIAGNNRKIPSPPLKKKKKRNKKPH